MDSGGVNGDGSGDGKDKDGKKDEENERGGRDALLMSGVCL